MDVLGGGDIYWKNYQFGANQEVYVKLVNVDASGGEQDLLLKSQSNSGYAAGLVEVYYSASSHVAQVWTYTSAQGWVQRGSDLPVSFANGDILGARATSTGQVSVYKNGVLQATRDVTAWPYYDDGGYIGVWFVNAGSAYGDDFGGGSMPGASLLGAHVKALLVKAARNEKAFGKAQMMKIPPAGQVWKSYYFQGSVRIALRVQVNGAADRVYYLLADHLGSTTVSYRADGQETRFQSYKPWGEVREGGNSLPTDRTFTGQRWSASIGLSFFNARWFDSMLGRFISPDTIIPGAGNSQAWDRYAGLGNNPVRYTDPSGHVPCLEDGYCVYGKYSSTDHLKYLSKQYGIKFTGSWGEENQWAVINGVQAVGDKFSGAKDSSPSLEFRKVYGTQGHNRIDFEWGCTECVYFAWTKGVHHIKFREMYDDFFRNTTLVVHELFHALEEAMVVTWSDGKEHKPARESLPPNYSASRAGLADDPEWTWQQSEDLTPGEVFADMGIGWIFDKWDRNPLTIDMANRRSDWMNMNMPGFLSSAIDSQR